MLVFKDTIYISGRNPLDHAQKAREGRFTAMSLAVANDKLGGRLMRRNE
jgi:hypothetical protein